MPAPPSVHLNLITKQLPVMASPGGLPVGILGGGVQTKKSHFPHPFSDPALRAEIVS